MNLTDKIKLFILDFDGTALGGYEPYDRFPDGLSIFLDKLSTEGVLWATCSTWHPEGQNQVFERSKVKSRPVRLAGRTSMNIGLYINDTLCLDAVWDQKMIDKKVEFYNGPLPEIRAKLESNKHAIKVEEYFDYIFSIEYNYSDKDKLLAELYCLAVISENTYILNVPDGNQIQVFPYYLSKAWAVKEIINQLGISSKYVMIAGDGNNDLPMLNKDFAHMQIVPSNASEEVKKTVTANRGIVSAFNYSDGVLNAASQLLEIKL